MAVRRKDRRYSCSKVPQWWPTYGQTAVIWARHWVHDDN